MYNVKPHKWRCDVKLARHVEGRKEENEEEIQSTPFSQRARRGEVPASETEDSTVLKNCVSESKQKRREKYRKQKKIVRDTPWEREQWVKRKKKFNIVISI